MSNTAPNTLEVLDLVLTGVKVVREAREDDGKLNAADLPKLFELVPKVAPAIDDAKEIGAEIEDLSSEEIQAMVNLVEDRLGAAMEGLAVETVHDALLAAAAINRIVRRHF